MQSSRSRAVAVLQIAIDVPLRRTFDYLPPEDTPIRSFEPGMLVRVPFRRRERIGVLVGVAASTQLPAAQLKRAGGLVDGGPLWSPALLSVIEWAVGYYHHPIGEVFAAALPASLRSGRANWPRSNPTYAITDAGRGAVDVLVRRAPRQSTLLRLLASANDGLSETELDRVVTRWRAPMRALQQYGFVQSVTKPVHLRTAATGMPPALTCAQHAAVAAVSACLGGFQAFLLNGVTGSGKTEVYLGAISEALARGMQALVLVPEIGLTPQTVARFEQRFGACLAVLHSAMTGRERALMYERARRGEAAVVIGTRSAVWTPLARPGVIIVDEEHDISYKQQEGFRYSARDVAVMRARRERVPIVLGSATPALESLHNAASGRYQTLILPTRPGTARLPELRLLDIRRRSLQAGLSEPLLAAIADTVRRREQALVFLNRRGYAPTVLCHACGAVTMCRRCDARMTYHRSEQRLLCHHCGSIRRLSHCCESCGNAEWLPLGQGTEHLAELLRQHFGDQAVVRIDRDVTRRKGMLTAALESARNGSVPILVGTQMLAKGHDFPGVTLAAVVDADSQLFSVDLRAGERLLQLIIQVAGRAGRGEQPGQVIIQTHHPDHVLFRTLLRDGYAGASAALLEERRLARLPPFVHLALLRAEASTAAAPEQFLQAVSACASKYARNTTEVLGPLPAPMTRRAGRYRAQLLLQDARRPALHALLDALVPQIEALPLARRVRWSLDVDPAEFY